MRKIGIASDHGGFELKEKLKSYLSEKGIEVVDYGTDSTESVDYPVYGKKAAKGVIAGEVEKAVVICGTGIGISLAANKVEGIRCALCTNEYMAKMSRNHNDANMLALGARVIGDELAKSILDTFLAKEFLAGRHKRRVDLIENC